jgi:hypothetical protein
MKHEKAIICCVTAVLASKFGNKNELRKIHPSPRIHFLGKKIFNLYGAMSQDFLSPLIFPSNNPTRNDGLWLILFNGSNLGRIIDNIVFYSIFELIH